MPLFALAAAARPGRQGGDRRERPNLLAFLTGRDGRSGRFPATRRGAAPVDLVGPVRAVVEPLQRDLDRQRGRARCVEIEIGAGASSSSSIDGIGGGVGDVHARRGYRAAPRRVRRWRRSGIVRSPSVRTVTSTAVRRQRWRKLPVALAMLAPSLVVLVMFVVYPLVGRSCSAAALRHTRWQLSFERVGPVRGRVPQRRVPARVVVTFKLALITVPLGLALGVGLAVLAHKPLRGSACSARSSPRRLPRRSRSPA